MFASPKRCAETCFLYCIQNLLCFLNKKIQEMKEMLGPQLEISSEGTEKNNIQQDPDCM